jgi:hypothetical protein
MLLVLTAHVAGAQQPAAPCTAPQHRQFDFWIGEWEVTGARGQRAGSNRIERILGGCALYESWEGASGSRGHSINAWDPGCHRTLKCGHGRTLQNRPGSGVGSMRDASAFINRWVDTKAKRVSVYWGSFGVRLLESTA